MKIFILLLFTLNFVNAFNSQSTNCGIKPNNNVGGRIVGGRVADRGEFPWVVSLQEPRDENEFQHFCGAVVINDRWILTAAHCFHRKKIEEIRGVLGTADLNSVDEISFITDFEKIVIHEDFEAAKYRNDIALLKTKKTIPIYATNFTINQICLPKENQSFSGGVTTSGWGLVSENADESNFLMTVNIGLFKNQMCKVFYKEAFHPNIMLCAGSIRGGKDACQGDSGGPLEKNVDGKVYLVGIVSFGEGCARQNRPSIYTKISHFTTWINNIIDNRNKVPYITKPPIPKETKHDVFITHPIHITKPNKIHGKYENECGMRKENSLYRIVGGRPALDNEFPWTVSLIRKSGSHFCGAAVLNNRWIITAAHCLHGRSAKSIRAVFGTTTLRSKSGNSFSTTFEEKISHPAFKYNGLADDIALLKTTDKIPNFSENQSINRICLPNINTTITDRAYVSGWGSIIEEGHYNDFLKVLLIRLYNDYECKLFYGKRFNPDTMICAGYDKGGSDACTGDSGGPLEQLIDKKSYLIGVVSFGVGCARPNLPGVYTKLSPYVDWIQSIIGQNETKKAVSPVVIETQDSTKKLNEPKILTKKEQNQYFKQIPMFCPRLCDQLCNSLQ